MSHDIECDFCGANLRDYSSRDDCCEAAKQHRIEEVRVNLEEIKEIKKLFDYYGLYYAVDWGYDNLEYLKVNAKDVAACIKRITKQ